MADNAETLWSRAHEHVRRGDFAAAVRDLAQCFQLLQAAGDPRIAEVHKRWTEVHKMYLEDGQRQSQPPAAQQQKAPSKEAEAEAAANAGDLDKAIGLYREAVQENPDNELITERLLELTQAKAKADELKRGIARAPVTAAAAAVVPSTAAAATTKVPAVVEDDWSDVQVDEPVARPVISQPAPVVARPVVAQPAFSQPAPVATAPEKVAPAMAPEDAPVGMQSLDVAFSVGEPIDAFQADEIPVTGKASLPPSASSGSASSVDADVAFLEELSARAQKNRRKTA